MAAKHKGHKDKQSAEKNQQEPNLGQRTDSALDDLVGFFVNTLVAHGHVWSAELP